MQVSIVKETEDWIALNKPAGMLSIPDREGKELSVKSFLQDRYGEIFTVHRLDRDTSGIIVFAKNSESHKFFSQLFEERTIEKIYIGIVTGTLSNKKAIIDLPISEHPSRKGMMSISSRGKASVTEYEVKEEFGKYSILHFNIHTGRTHQIRVHMQNLGHPLVCDILYGDGKPIMISGLKKNFKLAKNEEEERPILARLGLHAFRLKFTDSKGAEHELEAEPPKDIRAFIQQLRKWKG